MFLKKLNELFSESLEIASNITEELKKYDETWRLKNGNAKYVDTYIIDFIGFLDSLPNTSRYNQSPHDFKSIAIDLREKVEESLKRQKIYNENSENIRINGLGLGLKHIKRKPEYIDSCTL